MSTTVSGLFPLTLRLTRARFAAHEGESLLYGASVLASAVSAAIAFTVAGGTWLFYNRWQHPHGLIAEVIAEDPTFDVVTSFYFALAIIACALIVPSVVALAGAGAQLGARGRERRLATLRLVGLSSGDVTRMALLDALIQAVAGTVIGAAVYLLTIPLWSNLEMLGMPLTSAEMLLPWWLLVSLGVALIAVSTAAAAWGLRQVRISPLGVSRRTNKPFVKGWRVAVFAVILVVAVIAANVLRPDRQIIGFIVLGLVLVLVVGGINLIGPWLLQMIARGLAHTPSASMMWACRRVVADAKGTWRRIASTGMLSFIAGYMAFMPITLNTDVKGPAAKSFVERCQWDMTTGAIITLAAGFLLMATSTLISQASATIERAEQSRALRKIGAPDGFSLRVMWLETCGPLVVTIVISAALGAMMAAPMARTAMRLGMDHGSSFTVMMVVLAAGLGVTAAALSASHPLQRRILGTQERPND